MTKKETTPAPLNSRELLAKNMVELRVERGWGQDEMSRLTGIARSKIHQIEGKRRNLTMEGLEQLAQAFSVPIARLFKE